MEAKEWRRLAHTKLIGVSRQTFTWLASPIILGNALVHAAGNRRMNILRKGTGRSWFISQALRSLVYAHSSTQYGHRPRRTGISLLEVTLSLIVSALGDSGPSNGGQCKPSLGLAVAARLCLKFYWLWGRKVICAIHWYTWQCVAKHSGTRSRHCSRVNNSRLLIAFSGYKCVKLWLQICYHWEEPK